MGIICQVFRNVHEGLVMKSRYGWVARAFSLTGFIWMSTGISDGLL
jgi:hypothetical protein